VRPGNAGLVQGLVMEIARVQKSLATKALYQIWDKPEDMRESWMLGNGHVQFGGGGKPYHPSMIC